MAVPTQKYRIDVRDLNKNIAIGIALPFNAPGVFRSTYSTKDQVKYNLLNLILTNKGERVFNPEFGSDVRKYIFEQITDDSLDDLKQTILTSIQIFLPEISVVSIIITPEVDYNLVTLKLDYQLILSGDKDNVIIEFQ